MWVFNCLGTVFLALLKISAIFEGVFHVFMGKTSTKSKYKLSDMKVRKRSILALKCTFGVQNRLKHTQLNEYVWERRTFFSCTWYKSLLTGLDTTDFKTKVDPEHLVKPESLHSTFDKPASVSIALSKWYYESHIYIVVTSYKYLRNGERCQEGKEFDCFSYNFLSASTDRMCISTNLACDGVPNCGQSFLPNQVSCYFFLCY